MRTRPLKPCFFKNELLARCAFEWRILFEGLWGLADREGRLKEELIKIKGEVLPNDPVDVAAGLERLADVGLITRYTTPTGQRLIAINCWPDHARPYSDEPASKLPGPEGNARTLPQLSTAADATLPLAFDDDDAPLRKAEGPLLNSEGPLCLSSVPSSVLSSVPDSVPPSTRVTRAGEGTAEAAPSTRQERFERFWEAYPRKHGRGAAFRSWERLKPTDALLARMLAAIAQQRHSPSWQREGGRFIPKPANWLDDEGWLDEAVVTVAAAVSPSVQRDLDHVQKSREVARLVRDEGLSFVAASRRVGYH